MKTGDLLLFSYNGDGFFGCFTECIKKCTHSKFSHIGMIIEDPTFIDPTLKGIYVWESSWGERYALIPLYLYRVEQRWQVLI